MMLGWMCGVTMMDRIRKERIRGTTKGDIPESAGKKIEVARTCHENVGKRVKRMDVEGRRRKRKTEGEVDGRYKCGLEGEETVGKGGDEKPGGVGTTCQKHRLHIDVGKDALEDSVIRHSFCVYCAISMA